MPPVRACPAPTNVRAPHPDGTSAPEQDTIYFPTGREAPLRNAFTRRHRQLRPGRLATHRLARLDKTLTERR
jgi:hypothetical protein